MAGLRLEVKRLHMPTLTSPHNFTHIPFAGRLLASLVSSRQNNIKLEYDLHKRKSFPSHPNGDAVHYVCGNPYRSWTYSLSVLFDIPT
jgi:hypothetical protein